MIPLLESFPRALRGRAISKRRRGESTSYGWRTGPVSRGRHCRGHTGCSGGPGCAGSVCRRTSQPGNFEQNVDAAHQLGELATTKGIAVSRLALAWLLAQGEHIMRVTGTRGGAHIEENSAAADITLTQDDLDAIREILPTGGFDARYADVPAGI
ncbi:aldo/keto reductase [Kitasatospora sp. NPDC057965]|uniref:aldo/keto reductase n=1 Tax=Kitasatospora sp. NPDC057965 TaxID=3346291 RepID=UPI0036DE46DD